MYWCIYSNILVIFDVRVMSILIEEQENHLMWEVHMFKDGEIHGYITASVLICKLKLYW